MKCPRCDTKLEYYNGSLGYESLVCPMCKLDIKDDKTVSIFAKRIEELKAEIDLSFHSWNPHCNCIKCNNNKEIK